MSTADPYPDHTPERDTNSPLETGDVDPGTALRQAATNARQRRWHATASRPAAKADDQQQTTTGRAYTWKATNRLVRPVDQPAAVSLVRRAQRTLGALRTAAAGDEASLHLAMCTLLPTAQLPVPLLLDTITRDGSVVGYVTTWATGPDNEVSALDVTGDDSLAAQLEHGQLMAPADALDLLAPLGTLLDTVAKDGVLPVELSPDHLIADNGSLRLVGMSRHGYSPTAGVRPAWANRSAATTGLLGQTPPPQDPAELADYQARAVWALAGWLACGRPPADLDAVCDVPHLQAYLRLAGLVVDRASLQQRPLGRALAAAASRQRVASATLALDDVDTVVLYDTHAAFHPEQDPTYLRSLVGGTYDARVIYSSSLYARVVLTGTRLTAQVVNKVSSWRKDDQVKVRVTGHDLGRDDKGRVRGLLADQAYGAAVPVPDPVTINPEAVRLAACLDSGRPVLGVARVDSSDLNHQLAGLMGAAGWVMGPDDPGALIAPLARSADRRGRRLRVLLVGMGPDRLPTSVRACTDVVSVAAGSDVSFRLSQDPGARPVRWDKLPFITDHDLTQTITTVFGLRADGTLAAGRSAARQVFTGAFAMLSIDPQAFTGSRSSGANRGSRPGTDRAVLNLVTLLSEAFMGRPELIAWIVADLAGRRSGIRGLSHALEDIVDAAGLLSAAPARRQMVVDLERLAADRLTPASRQALLSLAAWLGPLSQDWDRLRPTLAVENDAVRAACLTLTDTARTLLAAPDAYTGAIALAASGAGPHAAATLAAIATADPRSATALAAQLADVPPALLAVLDGLPEQDVPASLARVSTLAASVDRDTLGLLTSTEVATLVRGDVPVEHLRMWGTALVGLLTRGPQVGFDTGALPQLVALTGTDAAAAPQLTAALLALPPAAWSAALQLPAELASRWWARFGNLQLLAPVPDRWTLADLVELASAADDLDVLASWLTGGLDAATLRSAVATAADLSVPAGPVVAAVAGGQVLQVDDALREYVHTGMRHGTAVGDLLTRAGTELDLFAQYGQAMFDHDVAALRTVGLLGWPVERADELGAIPAQTATRAATRLASDPDLARELSTLPADVVRALLADLPDLPTGCEVLNLADLAQLPDKAAIATLALATGAGVATVAHAALQLASYDPVQVHQLLAAGEFMWDLKAEDARWLASPAVPGALVPALAQLLVRNRGARLAYTRHPEVVHALLGAGDVPEDAQDQLLAAVADLPPSKVSKLGITSANVALVATLEADTQTRGALRVLADYGPGVFDLLSGPHGATDVRLLAGLDPDSGAAGFLIAGGEPARQALRKHGDAVLTLATATGTAPQDAARLVSALDAVDQVLGTRQARSSKLAHRLTGRTWIVGEQPTASERVAAAAGVVQRDPAGTGRDERLARAVLQGR